MCKKIIHALSLFLIPLFCLFFSPKVHAVNLSYNPSLYSIFEDDNFISIYNNIKENEYYQIGYISPSYYTMILNNNYDYSCIWEYGSLSCSNSSTNFSGTYYNNTFSNPLNSQLSLSSVFNNFSSSKYVISSTNDIVFTSPIILNVSDGTYTWSCTPTQDTPCIIPDLLTFYRLYYDDPFPDIPPVSPDSFPVLSSFYTITISKIAYLSEFFSSNLIYLAIISIFIFITILLLIKRRLF